MLKQLLGAWLTQPKPAASQGVIPLLKGEISAHARPTEDELDKLWTALADEVGYGNVKIERQAGGNTEITVYVRQPDAVRNGDAYEAAAKALARYLPE